MRTDSGNVIFFDDASNARIRQSGVSAAPKSNAGAATADVRVIVMGSSATGSTDGPTVHITSIKSATPHQ